MGATIAVRRASKHRWTHLSPADSQRALRAANAAASRWTAAPAWPTRRCQIRGSGHRIKASEPIALARRPKGRRPRMLLSVGTAYQTEAGADTGTGSVSRVGGADRAV